MALNNEMNVKNITALATRVFSTKTRDQVTALATRAFSTKLRSFSGLVLERVPFKVVLAYQQLASKEIPTKFFHQYQQFQGELVKVINGKLVNWTREERDHSQETLADVQLSLHEIEERLSELEKERVNERLNRLERRFSKQIASLAIAGVLGIAGLGFWLGSERNLSEATIPSRQSAGSPKSPESPE